MHADSRRWAAPNIGVHPRSSAVPNNCACSISLLSINRPLGRNLTSLWTWRPPS